MSIFAALNVYHDLASRSAAMNMAIDEALLESAAVPSIRFYRWESPALSFGYFGRFADVADKASERDLVRRWTGGGIVFHGEDLTYSVVIPANDPVFAESSMSIYENVHRALGKALLEAGQRATVAGVDDPGFHVNATGYNGLCFANPVRADVMIGSRKVAGAAQRRTRAGLLQQGSVQYVDLGNDLAERFAQALSEARCEKSLDKSLIERAEKIAEQKYGTDSWLRRR
jgi:lipoyl(octanoyl) transferase